MISALSKRQIAPTLLSLLILSLALALLFIGDWLQDQQEQDVSIREVTMFSPPPPPPPPPTTTHQTAPANTLDVQVTGSGATVPVLNVKPVKLTMAKPEAVIMEDTIQNQWPSLDINWDAFELDDLDSSPSLLTPIRVTFPRSLEQRGIRAVTIELEVMIDEKGNVSLIKVVKNPYQELNPVIRTIVRDSRFSAPTKDQQPVRARFIWPIELKS